MAKTREAFTTPLGRIVQGDVFVAQTKDQQGNLRVYKSGPNVGQPNPQFFIAVAFPKVLPNGQPNHEFEVVRALLERTARAEWPGLFPAGGAPINAVTNPSVNPLFTMKLKDGDDVDRNGKSNATKPGFAGHWVLSFSSQYAPKACRPIVENAVNPQDWESLAYDPAAGGAKPIKCGDYVRISGSTSGNDSPNTPGLYVNVDMVELKGIGEAIVSGPDAASAFGGGGTTALPAGVQSAVGSPALPGATAFAGGAGAPPPPGTTTAPPPPATTPPPPPAGPVMLPAAGATTYDQYIAAGWTDAQLIASGYMQAPVAAAPPPAGNVEPYSGYMDTAGASSAAPPPPPVSAPDATVSPTNVMLPAAGGKTYEDFIGAGWTHAQLVTAGYIAA